MVRVGADDWAQVEHLLEHRRIALISHPAAVDTRGIQTYEKAFQSSSFQLTEIWGAEHGYWGCYQDMECVPEGGDPWFSIPHKSLYTEKTLRPPDEWFEEIDGILFDMQDIGTRYYTFHATLALTLEACSGKDVRIVVLDRPNPLNGKTIEGPLLDPSLRSLVGIHTIPVRHGLTTGEFARLYAHEKGLDVDLHIVPLQGWKRWMDWADLHREWLPTSPNMPSLQAVRLYPGMCLLEATNISEGRGTCKPFEWIGAPWINPFDLACRLNAYELPGIRFNPIVFRPMFQKHAGKLCGGVSLHVTDVSVFKSFLTGLVLLKELVLSDEFSWRTDPYEFVSDIHPLDLLTGNPSIRRLLETNASLEELETASRPPLEVWYARIEPILIYEE